MNITRRQFLKYCGGSAAALGLSGAGILRLERALADLSGPAVIWLQGASCSGCSVSLLNKVANADGPAADNLLLNYINLKFHPTVMAAAGDLAVASAAEVLPSGGHFLVVEGAIPTGAGGAYCCVWEDPVTGDPVTALEAVREFAQNAAGIIACGSCASFGGIPAGAPNPTGCVGVSTATGRTVINIPGCPPHPDWIIGTIAYILANGALPRLDRYSRPATYYPSKLCTHCINRERDETHQLGTPGCLEELGCNGEETWADCSVRKWNNGVNWCVGARNPCVGCTEPGFPDRMSPFYKFEEEEEDDARQQLYQLRPSRGR